MNVSFLRKCLLYAVAYVANFDYYYSQFILPNSMNSLSGFCLRLPLPIFSNGRQIFLWQFIIQEEHRVKRKNKRGSIQLQRLMPDLWKVLISCTLRGAAVTRGLSIFNCVSSQICMRLTIWLLEGRHAHLSCLPRLQMQISVCTNCRCSFLFVQWFLRKFLIMQSLKRFC